MVIFLTKMSNLFNHDLNQTQEDTEGQVLVLYKTPETISALDELDTCFSGLRKDLQDVANPQRQSNGIIEIREHDSLRQHLVTDTSRTSTGSVEPASENIFIANPVSVNNICKELTKTLSKPLKSTLPPVGFNFAFIRKKVKKIGLLDKRSMASVRPSLRMEVVLATSLNVIGMLSKAPCWFLENITKTKLGLLKGISVVNFKQDDVYLNFSRKNNQNIEQIIYHGKAIVMVYWSACLLSTRRSEFESR